MKKKETMTSFVHAGASGKGEPFCKKAFSDLQEKEVRYQGGRTDETKRRSSVDFKTFYDGLKDILEKRKGGEPLRCLAWRKKKYYRT